MRFGRFAAVACILLMLFASAALADKEYPQVQRVFGLDRVADADVVYMMNDDVLRGQVTNTEFGIYTPYALVKVPADKCAGISFSGAAANNEILATVNYNRISGIVADPYILFKDSEGKDQKIRKESIRHIVFHQAPAETSFVDPAAETDLFVMANGDLITGKAEPQDVQDQIKSGAVEEFSIKADFGTTIEGIYKTELKAAFTGEGNKDAISRFPVATAVMNLGPSLTKPGPDVWNDVPQELVIAGGSYEKRRMGPVKFSHMKHNQEYGVSCAECHHWQDDDPVYECSACHDADQKQGKVLKLKDAFHTDCKGCHQAVVESGKYKNAPYLKCNQCHEDVQK